MSTTVRVPAKVNLWLEVIGKRPDGYHELSSLMLPIGIYDTLDVAVQPGAAGIALECDHPEVPQDARNLAWRAAQSYLEAAGIASAVTIRIAKRIPVAAGLGGGSADAAAVLLALEELLGHPLPPERLQALALSLGADVPFFLHQKPALATGVGERLEPVSGVPAYPLVLLKPPLSVATSWVYRSLKLTRGEARIKLGTFLVLPWQLRHVMENDLESVTLHEFPLLSEMKTWLLDNGAVGALMSGSGPTVFGVFAEENRAQAVAALSRQRWPDCWGAATTVLSEGRAQRGL